MNILIVAVITLCGDLVFGQYLPCLSANGSRRPCIPFSQCEQLLSLAKKPDRTDEDTKLLHKSFCGSRGNVAHVCCPEPNTGQRVSSPLACNTPDGKIGECINLFSCPHLTNLLQPPVPQEAISFVQSSRCFGPEQQSVCCGPPPTIPRYTTPRTITIPEYDTLEDPAEPADCPALMTAFPPARSTNCCGISVGVGNKIFGNTTGIDEYPWAVVIEYSIVGTERTALSCGGALISGKYVLTAAHCLAGRILQSQIPKKVRLGEYDTSNEGKDCILTSGGGVDCTDGATRIRIEKTIPHPKYVYGVSKNHDIGLIRLRDTAPYTDFIRPVCLPPKDLTKPENTPPYFSMYAVGWGATEDGAFSTLKRDVNLPFVSREKCQPVYNSPGRSVSLWEGQLCAGGKEAMDACKGDSGGPLVYENQEKFELIGIVSFGVGCGAKGVPGIYTNVYEYLDWIKSVIVA